MLNFLRYQHQTAPSRPTGPNFKRARKVELWLRGSRFKVMVPRHRSIHPISAVTARKNVTLAPQQFQHRTHKGMPIASVGLIYRKWEFYNSWLGRRIATCDFGFDVYAIPDSAAVNYFNPRAFEQGLAYILECHNGCAFSNGHQMWLSPMEWQPLTKMPCVAAKFSTLPSTLNIDANLKYREIAFPVTKNLIGIVSFRMYWNHMRAEHIEKYGRDVQWVDLSEMEMLIDQVINSIEFELSPEAQVEQREALAGLEDTSLVKEFPPIKFRERSDT